MHPSIHYYGVKNCQCIAVCCATCFGPHKQLRSSICHGFLVVTHLIACDNSNSNSNKNKNKSETRTPHPPDVTWTTPLVSNPRRHSSKTCIQTIFEKGNRFWLDLPNRRAHASSIRRGRRRQITPTRTQRGHILSQHQPPRCPISNACLGRSSNEET